MVRVYDRCPTSSSDYNDVYSMLIDQFCGEDEREILDALINMAPRSHHLVPLLLAVHWCSFVTLHYLIRVDSNNDKVTEASAIAKEPAVANVHEVRYGGAKVQKTRVGLRVTATTLCAVAAAAATSQEKAATTFATRRRPSRCSSACSCRGATPLSDESIASAAPPLVPAAAASRFNRRSIQPRHSFSPFRRSASRYAY